MELKFDNEIDAILRGLAKEPNFANSPSEHPDADLISAFAENVLTGDVRVRAMSHFADCNRCRMILTNVVKQNAEFEQETVHAVATPIIETKKVSWFEKLFTVPNLAYTFGALTLLFVGIIGLTFLQSNKNSDVAKLDKNEPAMSKGTSGASSEGEVFPKEYSNSNAAANSVSSAANVAPSSSSANAVANPPMPSATISGLTNSSGGVLRDTKADKSAANVSSEAKPSVSQPTSRNEEKQDKAPATKSIDGQETYATPAPAPYAPSKTTDVAAEDSAKNAGVKTEIDADETEITRGKAVPKAKKDIAKSSSATGASLAKPLMEDKETSSNRKTVNGKTFSNVNGVWTDSAYTGGGTKKVKRSSDDYKKLDQGLQNIGNSLGGTVIVVWNGKAYKIQ